MLKQSLRHGWSYDARPQVYEYDETATDDFGFARLWSGGMSTALLSRAGIVHVAAIVEGTAEVTVDGSKVQIEAGQIILLDGDSELHAHSPKPWARYGWFSATASCGGENIADCWVSRGRSRESPSSP